MRFDIVDDLVLADAVYAGMFDIKSRIDFVPEFFRHDGSDPRAAEGSLTPAHAGTGSAFDSVEGGDRDFPGHRVVNHGP